MWFALGQCGASSVHSAVVAVVVFVVVVLVVAAAALKATCLIVAGLRAVAVAAADALAVAV